MTVEYKRNVIFDALRKVKIMHIKSRILSSVSAKYTEHCMVLATGWATGK
jgi:hypothetical protein